MRELYFSGGGERAGDAHLCSLAQSVTPELPLDPSQLLRTHCQALQRRVWWRIPILPCGTVGCRVGCVVYCAAAHSSEGLVVWTPVPVPVRFRSGVVCGVRVPPCLCYYPVVVMSPSWSPFCIACGCAGSRAVRSGGGTGRGSRHSGARRLTCGVWVSRLSSVSSVAGRTRDWCVAQALT